MQNNYCISLSVKRKFYNGYLYRKHDVLLELPHCIPKIGSIKEFIEFLKLKGLFSLNSKIADKDHIFQTIHVECNANHI
jgi:hypothetical protein